MDSIIVNTEAENDGSIKYEPNEVPKGENSQTKPIDDVRTQEECSLPLKIVTIVGVGLLVYYVMFNRSPCDSNILKMDRAELNISWNDLLFLQFRNKDGWTIDNIWPVESTDPESKTRYCKVSAEHQRYISSRDRHSASIRERLKGGHRWSSYYDEYKYMSNCLSHIEKLSTELRFLRQGVEWYDRYNVGETLFECGIDPDDSKLYPNSVIEKCFRERFNVEPKIGCRYEMKFEEYILHEVGFCFDQDLKLKNCSNVGAPSQGFQYCSADFLYPATFSLI